MQISKQRSILTRSSARLRRARRLYVRLGIKAVLESTNDSVMDHMAKRMAASGLYAAASISNKHDMRFRIARMIFNLQRKSFGGTQAGEWTFWCIRNGFSPTSFHRVKKAVA